MSRHGHGLTGLADEQLETLTIDVAQRVAFIDCRKATRLALAAQPASSSTTAVLEVKRSLWPGTGPAESFDTVQTVPMDGSILQIDVADISYAVLEVTTAGSSGEVAEVASYRTPFDDAGSGLIMRAGSASMPALRFVDAPDTGWYTDGDDLKLTAGGSNIATASADELTIKANGKLRPPTAGVTGNVCIGDYGDVEGDRQVLIGDQIDAYGTTIPSAFNVVIGYNSSVGSSFSSRYGTVCIGANIDGQHSRQVNIGDSITNTKTQSVCIGYAASNSENQGICIGSQTIVDNGGQIAIGQVADADNTDSIAIGAGVSSRTAYDVAVGSRYAATAAPSLVFYGCCTIYQGRELGRIEMSWEDSTDSTRRSSMALLVHDHNASPAAAASIEGMKIEADGSGNAELSFYGGTPVAKPSVTGSRAGNAALASALTALANLGLITDSSTA